LTVDRSSCNWISFALLYKSNFTIRLEYTPSRISLRRPSLIAGLLRDGGRTVVVVQGLVTASSGSLVVEVAEVDIDSQTRRAVIRACQPNTTLCLCITGNRSREGVTRECPGNVGRGARLPEELHALGAGDGWIDGAVKLVAVWGILNELAGDDLELPGSRG